MKKNKKATGILKDNQAEPVVKPVKKEVISQTGDKIKFIDRSAIVFSGVAICLFIFLRLMFPVPDYIPDSKGYILGAINDADIGYRPMGISVFMAKVHNIDPSISFLVWVQFLFHLLSGLAIVHAFRLIFPFNKTFVNVFYGISLVNPALLYLAHSVTSDSLFCSFTIGWIALAIYLIRNPKWYFLAAILVLLWFTMYIRYNALIYPVITIAAVVMTRHRYFILGGAVCCILITWAFYNTIEERMELATDVRIFSGFSGWQLASNAMTAYKANEKRGIVTDDTVLQRLDKASIQYIDSMNKVDPGYKTSFEPDFIWVEASPFKLYTEDMRQKKQLNQFSGWTTASLDLNKYGQAVIKQYPTAFLQYYLLPNSANFLFPKLEHLGKYYAPEVEMFPMIREWYELPERVSARNKDLPAVLNKPSQIIYFLCSIAFMPGVILLLVNRKKWKVTDNILRVVIFVAIFWLCKMGFEVFAAPLTLRYVVMLTPVAIGVILIGIATLVNRRGSANA